MTGSGLAVFLSVVAGLAGAVQVSMMSQLGDRISIVGAVAFATLFTAVVSFGLLLVQDDHAVHRFLSIAG